MHPPASHDACVWRCPLQCCVRVVKGRGMDGCWVCAGSADISKGRVDGCIWKIDAVCDVNDAAACAAVMCVWQAMRLRVWSVSE